MIHFDPGSVIFGLLCGGLFGSLMIAILAGFKQREMEAAMLCVKCRVCQSHFCPTCVTDAMSAPMAVVARDSRGRFVKAARIPND